MNNYNDRELKEAMQAKCRRLESAGFRIVTVQYGDSCCRFQPLTPYDLRFLECNTPKIRIF